LNSSLIVGLQLACAPALVAYNESLLTSGLAVRCAIAKTDVERIGVEYVSKQRQKKEARKNLGRTFQIVTYGPASRTYARTPHTS